MRYPLDHYDANGNADWELDAYDVRTSYTYDADKRLTQKVVGTGPAGETDQQQITQFVWDSAKKARLNQIKVYGSSLSQPISQTTYTYYPDGDAKARLLASVAVKNLSATGIANNTLTTTYSYTLHPSGMVATMTVDGPLSGTADAVVSTYDTAGNLTKVQNSLSQATTYSSYNAMGQPGRITGPNGDKVDYTYNARGSVLTEKRWVGSTAYTTTHVYDTRGQRSQTTYPDGEIVQFGYDNYGRQTSTFKHFTGELDNDPATYNDEVWETQATTYYLNSDPTGHKTTYRYQGKEWDDQLGKPINVGYTNTQREDFIDYDAGGFVSARRGNHGQNVRYTYNANGDLASVIDSLNHTTSYAYDRQRRVNHVTDAASGHTWLTYDPVGRLVQVKDPRNLTTTYSYDGFGQLWSQASPDTGTTTFAYNAYGQRTGMTRADGSTLAYSYDGVGRLKTTGNATRTRTYGYDTCTSGKGRLCTFGTTGGGATDSTSLTYTAQGQVATRTDKVNGATDVTGYTYDGSGRLAGISYPGGISVGYGYVQGLLTQITATVNGTASTVAGLSGYQVFGPPTYLSYGNGVWRQTNYDSDGRLTGISSNVPGGPIQSLTYGFDADDRITAITDGVEATLTQNMGYDALSRMTSASIPGSNASTFAYDAVGNRIGRTDSSPTPATTYTYASTSNRLLQSVQGSLTRTYSVNAVGDTYAFTGPDGLANQLTYDPFGRLASHVRSGVTTTYAVNAQDQRVAKTNPTTSSRYIYAGQNQLLAEYTNGQWTSYIWNGNDPVALVRANQIYYIHPDHLGRPEKVTNSGKAIVWKANNFGFNRGVALDGIGGLNLGFPGQYWDAESGLWHNGYRDYDYSSGRYLQSDPIGISAGSNTYAYAFSNPLAVTDPSGLEGVGSWTYPAGPQRAAYQAVAKSRGSDYYRLSANYYVFNGSVVLARNGTIYAGGGVTMNLPHNLQAGISLSAGTMNQCDKPTDAQLDRFFTGAGFATLAAYGGIGGGFSFSPGQGSATEVGVGVGVQLGRSSGGFGADVGAAVGSIGSGW